ncbi:Apoptotic protease-activating factor 1 [Trichoplax sp. H2]|nr:Apoptotic protease-activating factor 1 [Trichoplax sp. H2]|eukprot:RDD36192.1 Apoptotic protease-activating factor 1 [Trichoplax sp. H2]
MAGSGKTTTVCQSVRQATNMGLFKSNGCYWMKIGHISNIELCQELKILGIRLNMEWKENIQSIGEICAHLSSSLEANSRLSDTLFIFDDIWKKDHYEYLSFAKKSISTSRFKYLENELDHHCISLPENLTYDEAIELLALLAGNDNAQTLRENPVVKKVIDSCQGLPLAIALIGGLDLKTEKEWNAAKDIIADESIDIGLAHYDFNLYGTLQLSVDSLDNENKRLFEKLAVFKRVSIPIQSVTSLWYYNEINKIKAQKKAQLLLREMHNKSLLTYDKENTCMSNKLSYICFMLILNWEDFDQLKQLLKQQQPCLDVVDRDVIQMILWVDMSDSWIKQRALQLAKENVRNGESYWSMSRCSTSATTQYTYDACKAFGKNKWDQSISVSNPDFGPLRIIGTQNNYEDCQIVIQDYQTSQTVLEISTPSMHIGEVEISADGRTAAFQQLSFMDEIVKWIVYDLDKNEEISFAQNDQGEDVKTDFDSVQFCPAQSQTQVIMTLSRDFREVRIWKIEGNCIRPTNKQISRQYKIEYCRWVLVQDSACVLLWEEYRSQRGKFEDYERDDPEKWINECQIEMWNAQQWTCRSFKVPAFIHAKDDDRYFATNHFRHCLPLTYINIYRDAAYMIISYSKLDSGSSTIGLLKMEQDIEFENQFRPILHDVGNVVNILVSGDQSMIAIDCDMRLVQYWKLILKMSGDQVQSRVELDQYGRSMFIPGSNRLLIYDEPNVYEYNLQGDKIAWQDISQTKSVDVGRPQRNPKTTVNTFDLIEFVGIEDCRKYRELINGILEEESTAKDGIRFRYRKKDYTLILFPRFPSYVITVNLTTGKKSVYRLTLSDYARVVYVDDDYLYVWERKEDDACSLKCYKFGDGEHRTQLLQNIEYQRKEGLISKIMMNSNSNQPAAVGHSPLRVNKEKLVDVWGEKDAEMIANVPGFDDLLLLLENGDHIAILDQDGNLCMKRYKDKIKYFHHITQFFNHENLWSDKQLILYQNRSSLNIYSPQTQITLPFRHFRIWDMQWNLQHSQLIIRSDQDYCLVTPVKKT